MRIGLLVDADQLALLFEIPDMAAQRLITHRKNTFL
jgi:hypothetical protein